MARKRLKGSEARARILDAATSRLREVGPDGLKLTKLAKELGVSHQAILHHFGNRQGLLKEVVRSAMDQLQADLSEGLLVLDDQEEGAQGLIHHAFDVMVDKGQGRLLGHLALARPNTHELDRRRPLQMLAAMAHLVREKNTGTSHDPKDTSFVFILLALAVLGSAVFEHEVLVAAGLGEDEGARDEFRAWLASVIIRHFQEPSLPQEEA